MKLIVIIIKAFLFLVPAYSQSWYPDYDFLLNKYVSSKGVNYKKMKEKDFETLQRITDKVSVENVPKAKKDQLAYYLNSYNTWMLKKAVDAYPTNSLISNDESVYKRRDIVIAGKTMSLDDLENKIIRKKFKEPRIHFALNCASKGCPPLHDEVLQGSTLEMVLEELTRKFLKLPNGLRSKGNTVSLNEIFKWFAVDFKRASPDGTVLGFIQKYENIDVNSEVMYLEYSWDLNER